MTESTVSPDLLEFLKSIASESRIKILLLFLDGQERTVNQIAEAVGLGQPTTSEHLAIMRRSGVLVSTKQGKEVFYQPDRERLLRHLNILRSILEKCCKL